MRSLFAGLLAATLGVLGASSASGHALQPGYAAIEQVGPTEWHVFWRKPDVSGRAMAIDLLLPETCSPRQGPSPMAEAGAWEASWLARCDGGLFGEVVAVPGLDATRTDVLIRLAPLEGAPASLRLTADTPEGLLPVRSGPMGVLVTYAGLGFEHILEGWDHLLFVFALMILVRDPWRLVGAVTAFTAAHSITLAASTLGWVALPPAPVEAVIALSIVFLAREIVAGRPGERRLSTTSPWLVTFGFGLLHGLGFAGALREIGLPQGDVPLALLAFNIGVEAGQLLFIAAAGTVMTLGGRLAQRPLLASRAAFIGLGYAIGGLSSLWLVERVVGFT